MSSNQYATYKETLQKIADIGYSAAVLNWDQEVNMPPKGAAARARQLATLSGLAHEMSTNADFGKLLEELKGADGLSVEESRNVAESWKEYSKNKKLSTAFVERMTMAVSKAFHAWNKARAANDFSVYQDELSVLVDLKLEQADLMGYEGHPYNALMDDYEPGATVAFLDPLFAGVKTKLTGILEKVRSRPSPEIPFAGKKFNKDQQWELGLKLLRQMHYDFDAGRQDLSAHPFTTNFSSKDVRVTTRVNEDDPLDMISSCIHEGGHALYEQGLLPENYGLPAGQYISLGVHESQSRLWENNVGRSRAYWQCNYPDFQAAFPAEMEGCSAETLFHASNLVKPSLIRVQADELTYHFHILIRYEIEKAILSKEVETRDLPALWNEMYKKYLGLDVPSDAQGVLQDIHWSHGSFGYFPTYSLGSFYAAQYFAQAEKEITGLKDMIGRGELLPLKLWLNENIHQHGRLYTADELCIKVTGESLNVDVFMRYIDEKLSRVYGW
ncbi:MAG: carboxypeptidase M32 [Bacteroidetes bacterium]|nr:carboxypeptidase M32 [Bacteroidota bacterium]